MDAYHHLETYLLQKFVISLFIKTFQYICGTIRRIFTKSNKVTVLKLYKIMAISTLLYLSANWTVQKKHKKIIE